MKRERAKCPWCGKEMAVHVPAGGDGSADVYPRHYDSKTVDRRRCAGSRAMVEQQEYVR